MASEKTMLTAVIDWFGNLLKQKNGVVALGLWFLFFSAGVVISSENFRNKLDGTTAGVGYLEFAWCFILAIMIYSPLNAVIVACLAGYLGGHMSRAQHDRTPEPKVGTKSYEQELREHRYLTEAPHLSAMRGLIGYLVMLSGVVVFSATPFSSAVLPEEYNDNTGNSGTNDSTKDQLADKTAEPSVGQAAEAAETRATETDASRAANAQDTKAIQAAKDQLKKNKKTVKADKKTIQLKARSIAESSQYARFGCLVTLLAFGLGYNPMIFERMISQFTARGIGSDSQSNNEDERNNSGSDGEGKDRRLDGDRRHGSPKPPSDTMTSAAAITGANPGAQPSPPAAAGAAEATPPPPDPG